jgi:hypothetical protein
MNDYISRQTVLRCIKESRDDIDWGQSEDGDAFLHYSAVLYRTVASKECVPAADVVPVRLGEWLDGYKMQTCSLCKCRGKKSWTFCPHCGAMMIYGEREE